MASMLCLGNGIRASTLLCSPNSIASTLRETRLRLGLRGTSPSLTSCYASHVFRPVIRASGHESSAPSRNEKNHNKIARAALGASLVLACALGAISLNLRINRKAIAGPRELFQKAPQVEEHPVSLAKIALQSFLDVTFYLASSDEVHRPIDPFYLPPSPSMEQVNDIKMHAAMLMKYGKPKEAISFLQKAYSKYEKNDPEPAYNVDMALVEILICQQKYKKALQRECLSNDDYQLRPSDARVSLYKAMIYTMLENAVEAKIWWAKYADSVEGGFLPIR